MLPDFHYIGNFACVLLSILFGKRFENHGLTQTHGHFQVPNLSNLQPVIHQRFGPLSPGPRKDLAIGLNLANAGVLKLLFDNNPDEQSTRLLLTAGEFYLQGIKLAEDHAELAFVNFVTAGEVLQSAFEFSDTELFDEQTLRHFDLVREVLGDQQCNLYRSRQYMIRRRLSVALTRLLNQVFFDVTECEQMAMGLRAVDITERLKAAYDLRSLYLHTGTAFGGAVKLSLPLNAESSLASSKGVPDRLKKPLSLTPTLVGIERILRFGLLRYIHLKLCPIDPRLDGKVEGLNLQQTQACS